MRPAHAVLVALILVVLVLSVPLAAGGASYSIHNHGGEGLGHVRGELPALRVLHGPLGSLDPSNEAVLIVGPRLAYTEAEARGLRLFLEEGGRALVADRGGAGRGLVQALQVGVDVPEARVFSTSYDRSPAFPLAEDQGVVPGMPLLTVLVRPHAVTGAGEPVLRAHELSWLDTDNNGRPGLHEPRGPWALARLVEVGAGQLLVVGDPDLFTAAMRGPSGDAAAAMLAWLSEDRVVVVDEGHRARADPFGMAPVLAGAAAGRVALAAAAVLVVGALVALRLRLRRIRPRRTRPAAPRDALDAAVRAELPP